MYTPADLVPLLKAKMPPDWSADSLWLMADALAEFSIEVAKMEREACAKIADGAAPAYPIRDNASEGSRMTANIIASAIRARNNSSQ